MLFTSTSRRSLRICTPFLILRLIRYLYRHSYLADEYLQNSLSEISVKLQPLRVEIAVDGSPQVEVRFIEVLLLESQLGNLEQRVARVDLVLVVLDHLLEVQDRITLSLQVVPALFGEDLAQVEVRFHI